MGTGQLWTIVGFTALGLIVYVYVLVSTYKALYRKVGPNEALVISGGKGELITTDRGERLRLGFRVVKGGGTLVNPLTEKADILSLELIKAEVRDQVKSKNGLPIQVDAVGQIKVKGDDISIRIAAEHFLSNSEEKIRSVAADVIASHLRAILGVMTPDEILADRESIARKIADASGNDLANMGLDIVSLIMREISPMCEAVATTGTAPVVQ